MQLTQISLIYDSITDVFNGDKRPLALAGIIPMSLEDLRYLLLYNGLIDINGNLHIGATREKFDFTILIYYSLKPQAKFTRPLPANIGDYKPE